MGNFIKLKKSRFFLCALSVASISFIGGGAFQWTNPPILQEIKSAVKNIIKERSTNKVPSYSTKTCNILEWSENQSNGKFDLIVGHAYGSPSRPDDGYVSPNLINFLNNINQQPQRIIFTGDVLAKPSMKRWRKISETLNDYTPELLIAPGNHDVGWDDNTRRDVFYQNFTVSLPHFIVENNQVIVIIDSTVEPWSIDDSTFKKINMLSSTSKNLFIFVHHIMNPDQLNIANSNEGFPGTKKMVKNLESIYELSDKFKEIYIISGDTGAFSTKPRVDCRYNQNVYFVAAGLGDDPEDQVLILQENHVYTANLRNRDN